MVQERRAFNFLSEYLRTKQNNREMYITDDVMYEPERATFLSGYIGDVSNLTQEDLERTPQVAETSALRQKYQLGIASVFVNPDTGAYQGGGFYLDLLRQIAANGGLTDNPNRLFGTPYYAWTPPIDYDKHINFSRYFWVGEGNAEVNGEYITKEPAASQVVLYEVTSGGTTKRVVRSENSLPLTGSSGDFVEDASTGERLIYRWTGSGWSLVDITPVDDIPSDLSEYNTGDYLYPCRTGPDYQRPLVWKYSDASGRWLAQPVIVSLDQPNTPREGSIWEDARNAPARSLRRYTNGIWSSFTWTPSEGPASVVPADGKYIYDTRELSALTDGWVKNNWWRHYEDLSPPDREARVSGDQAVRPIVEFWNGLEAVPGDQRDARNDFPMFQLYVYDDGVGPIRALTDANFPGVGTQGQSTIFQYRIGTGQDDLVLGFPVSFNDSGEFVYDLTMEQTTIVATSGELPGYRYFRDANTGLLHSVWAKSDVPSAQVQDSDGLYDLPLNITSNPDHVVLTEASRSQILGHIGSVIRSQDNFEGTEYGLNNYRWSDKNPTTGATLVDCENTLLRILGTLQSSALNIPDTIRQIAKDYNKVLFRFQNKMNQMWDDNTLSDPADNALVSPAEAVDAILTVLFFGRNESFPYYRSDMGTYVETQISAGSAVVIDPNAKPIFIPPSAARIGAAPTYVPGRFEDRDGVVRLRGHDGIIIDSFGDDRDLIWLELQNRFYTKVLDFFKTETSSFSSRFNVSNFFLKDFYGNFAPTTSIEPVSDVVQDYTALVAPAAGTRVFSTSQGVFAFFDGAKWLTRQALVDDVFLNTGDQQYYIFNGIGTHEIKSWNRPVTYDYTNDEFVTIIRREFERWVSTLNRNFVDNEDFNQADPFTWNYRSAGVEGHYLGIYRRVYHTVRPHSHPWEILGYTIEPDWWRSEYVPTTTAADGTPRYASGHPMWIDLQNGVINPISAEQRDAVRMMGPIPVNSQGELLDPIASGVVDEEALDQARIDDSWVYGDGAPVEQEFIESSFYPFAIALCGYLMKPGIWVDPLWSELYIDIGENQLWRAPHVVHRDTLTRPRISDLPIHLDKDASGNVIQRLGLNAWISERVAIRGANPETAFGDVIRNTQPVLTWKTAGYINENRTTVTTLSGKRIPFEDVHTVLHQSLPISENFCSGVLITREGTGYRVFGFDVFNPSFRIELPAIPLRGGQVELQQSYVTTPGQHEFTVTDFKLPLPNPTSDTARFAVLVNGLRLKPQHIQVVDRSTFRIEDIVTINGGETVVVSVLTTQSNPSTQIRKFTINGVDFPYFASGSGQFGSIEYGRYFDTSTDVINFMLGYGRALARDGWVFDEIDESGEIRDWMLGAKLFANWALSGTATWNANSAAAQLLDDQSFLFSPVREQAKFVAEFGHITNVESIQFGSYGVVDQNAEPIDIDDIFTSRVGGELTVTKTGETDIYGVRIFVSEYQHVVFFSNVTKFNDIIYDPVLGLYNRALRVDTYRSTDWNGRLEADGFVINDAELLPNFEKQARDMTRFYDRIDTIDDPIRRDQARNLYGWYPNDFYMDAIGADDRSRFDYYRGMIQAKGTVRPAIAFARGTRLGADNVIINEDWAWRFCEFGDRRREVVQFRVDKNDFREQIQIIQFGGPEVPGNNVIEVTDFSRTNIDPDTRWILPPSQGDQNQYNLQFPLKPDGKLQTEHTQYYSKLFDTTTGLTVLRHFHYDPELNKYDPSAVCELDYTTYYDPARYTHGPGADYSAELAWGPEEVGRYWWRTQRREFTDYRGLLPDYDLASREWGKLKYFRATMTRTDDVVTVTTLDPYTGALVNHNLTDGDQVEISGAQQSDYNGVFQIVTSGSTQFEYTVEGIPATPATGDIKVRVGFIEVFEWVESPVPPSEWANYIDSFNDPDAPTGIVEDPSNASYVVRTTTSATGVNTSLYYFWIKSNGGLNPIKTIRASDVERMLQSPTLTNTPWFAPVDANHMLVYTDGARVQDGYGIEIFIDSRELETHVEWKLISEGDQFKEVPSIIVDKLFDSMCGIDAQGNAVPSPLLADTEKYGSDFFPIQTVFVDAEAAIDVFVTALNDLLKTKNISNVPNLIGIFPLDEEGTFWSRTNSISPEYRDKAVYDVVVTEAIRDNRAASHYYAEGDLVKVTQSGNVDAWTGDQTGTTYVYQDGAFIEVGVDNTTAEINTTVANDPAAFREFFYLIYEVFEKVEQNSLIFALLYEMMKQSPECDWFFKTSYITVQVFTEIGQSPFVLPNEVEAVFANINDTKPYRTKVRSNTITYTLKEIEPFNVALEEFPDKKVVLRFDRLNCHLLEDGGWDGFAWDSELEGWDKPFWEFENLGQDEYYSVGIQTGNSIKKQFVFPAHYDPRLYNVDVIVLQNGQEVVLEDVGLSYTISKTHTDIIVTFNSALASSFTVEAIQTQGFYQGMVPTLGSDFIDTLFEATPSSWRHHVARTMIPGVYNPADDMEGCATDTAPEERIENTVVDSVNICVINDYTPAYTGWDTTPWDTTPWDEGPNNVGRRVFIMSIGHQETIPPGIEFFSTSENIIAGDTQYIVGTSPSYNIVQVRLNGVPVTEGVEYEFVEPLTNAVRFLPPENIVYEADGIQTTFSAADATAGIAEVRMNGLVLTEGVDYNVSGTDIVFVQPTPTLIDIGVVTNGVSFVGNGSVTGYEIGLDSNSLHDTNVFAFVNGNIVPTGEYMIGPSADVVLDTAPAVSDQVLFFGIGNEVSDPSSLFAVYSSVGNGITTSYVVGDNANSETSFVFVNGRYQVLGVDYTHPAFGTVEFTAPPNLGATIEVRTLRTTAYVTYDIEHVVVVASGGASDAITGLSDIDPQNIMVFVGDTIQDAYTITGVPDFTITDGNPDQLVWTGSPPSAGTRISVRLFRSIVIDQTPLVSVEPAAGNLIQIVPNEFLSPGDLVQFIYNGWPVGPIGTFTVQSAPGNYDVVNGVLTLDTPIPTPGGFVTVNYAGERKGDLPRSIYVRVPTIVDDVLADHTVYDDPTGFETNRTIGLVIINTTDDHYYEWNGSAWADLGAVSGGTQFLVRRTQQIQQFDGTNYTVLFNVGDIGITPPVLSFPSFGLGITFGTYTLGQTPNAAVEYPEAYQVHQHPGDC